MVNFVERHFVKVTMLFVLGHVLGVCASCRVGSAGWFDFLPWLIAQAALCLVLGWSVVGVVTALWLLSQKSESGWRLLFFSSFFLMVSSIWVTLSISLSRHALMVD